METKYEDLHIHFTCNIDFGNENGALDIRLDISAMKFAEVNGSVKHGLTDHIVYDLKSSCNREGDITLWQH